MDFGETDEIRELRSTLRKFVGKEMPRELARRWDKDDCFPRDVFQKLASLGVMGLTVPVEYGGLGRHILSTMIVIEELSRRSAAVSIPYIMSACYAGMNLAACGSDAQKAELLPRAAAGSLLFAYGWTEPDVGSDLASVRTVATRAGDKILVNGAKRFCSGANIADFIYTLVRTESEARYKNLTLLLIPPSTPGITITRIDSMGIKGVGTTDVIFRDVVLSPSSIVGGEDGWNNAWSMIMGTGLDVEKLEVAAMGLGIAQAALEDAWQYAFDRKQFGQPIASYQSVQHKLADMNTQVHAAKLILYMRLGWLIASSPAVSRLRWRNCIVLKWRNRLPWSVKQSSGLMGTYEKSIVSGTFAIL